MFIVISFRANMLKERYSAAISENDSVIALVILTLENTEIEDHPKAKNRFSIKGNRTNVITNFM